MAQPFKLLAICCLAFFILHGQSSAQEAKDNQSAKQATAKANDPDYGKLNELRTFIRKRNEAWFAIESARGVDEAGYIKIGGIEQWVTVRGQNRDNPVLLFLHGGPGDVTSSWSFAVFAPWEWHFTVAQWDERGSGRTYKRNGPGIAPTMTRERLAQDGIELAEYLRKHLGKEKIILVGHSFGSLLALRMIQARPDLFYAYVGTGQVSDEVNNYATTYDALVKKARQLGDQQALADLTRVGRPPYSTSEGYRVQWRWANRFEGADQFLQEALGLTLFAPGYSLEDIYTDEEGEMFSGEHLVDYEHRRGPKELGLKFSIPFFIFQGEEDLTTSTELARKYLDMVQAPRKAFVAIQGGGHFAVFMRSEQFLNELVKRVRPMAVGK